MGEGEHEKVMDKRITGFPASEIREFEFEAVVSKKMAVANPV